MIQLWIWKPTKNLSKAVLPTTFDPISEFSKYWSQTKRERKRGVHTRHQCDVRKRTVVEKSLHTWPLSTSIICLSLSPQPLYHLASDETCVALCSAAHSQKSSFTWVNFEALIRSSQNETKVVPVVCILYYHLLPWRSLALRHNCPQHSGQKDFFY